MARERVFVLIAQLLGGVAASGAIAAERAPVCTADCDRNQRVTIDEITRCAATLLANGTTVSACCDGDGDQRLAVSDLVVAVADALNGCAAPCVWYRPCDGGEQCDVWDSHCRGTLGGPTGICVPRPASCQEADGQPPVCGCNGVTYANDCERRRAGVVRQGPGPCQTFHCCPAGAIGVGVILVDFAPGTSEEDAAAIAAALGASVLRHWENIDSYLIDVPPGHELEFVARFAQEPTVVAAGPNHISCYPEAIPCACCPPWDDIICPELPPCLPA